MAHPHGVALQVGIYHVGTFPHWRHRFGAGGVEMTYLLGFYYPVAAAAVGIDVVVVEVVFGEVVERFHRVAVHEKHIEGVVYKHAARAEIDNLFHALRRDGYAEAFEFHPTLIAGHAVRRAHPHVAPAVAGDALDVVVGYGGAVFVVVAQLFEIGPGENVESVGGAYPHRLLAVLAECRDAAF